MTRLSFFKPMPPGGRMHAQLGRIVYADGTAWRMAENERDDPDLWRYDAGLMLWFVPCDPEAWAMELADWTAKQKRRAERNARIAAINAEYRDVA